MKIPKKFLMRNNVDLVSVRTPEDYVNGGNEFSGAHCIASGRREMQVDWGAFIDLWP